MTHPIEQHETVALLDGRYQLHERVGEGGMAEVHRAEDIILGRTVAVKLLKDDAEVLASPVRAHREVSALARVNDPSLVTLLEANLAPEGPRYLVMEYVDGPTLSRLLRAGPLSTLQVAQLAGQLASGLSAVHAVGLVHRDVKPSNILLAPSLSPAVCFHVKLADFGLAQLADATSVTTPGMVLGTAAYLAPEQVRGEASCPASDIYALGLVLLEALTGKRAFSHASGIGEVMARLLEPPAIPEDIDEAWAELLTRMTASDPAARPTAREVAGIAATLPTTTTRPATTAPLPTPVTPRIVPADTGGHAPHPVPAAHRRRRRQPGQRAWIGAGASAAALTTALVCLPFVSTGSNNPEPVAPVSVQRLVEDTSTGSTTVEPATVDTSSPAGVNAPMPPPGPAQDDQPAGGPSSKAEREADSRRRPRSGTRRNRRPSTNAQQRRPHATRRIRRRSASDATASLGRSRPATPHPSVASEQSIRGSLVGIQVCYWADGRGELLRVELETVPDRGEIVTLPSIDFTGRVLQRDFATTADGNEELLIQLGPAGNAGPSRWEQGRRARASRQPLRPIPPPPHWGQTAPEGEAMAAGTSKDPWVLRTAPGTSEYTMYRDGDELVCQVGSTRLTYQARAIDDLHTWLLEQGDWVPLGAADEQKPAADGCVEAWGRSDSNPVGGWYGTRKGYRGRFGMYLPPLLEELGMVELEHNPRSNRVRALPPKWPWPPQELNA